MSFMRRVTSSYRGASLALPGAAACLGLLLSCPPVHLSGAESPDRSLLTLDRVFVQQDFRTEEWGPARWLDDGSGYTTLEASEGLKDTRGAKDIVRYTPYGGGREIIVSAARLIPPGQEKPLKIEDYAWSRDTAKLLIFTNSKRVWRRNTRGDYWVLDLRGGKLKQLGGRAEPSSLGFATFSPDSSRVAYVSRNNLFVQSLENLRVTQLTTNGSDTLVNGTSDWVYEEEFGLRNGLRWSPDGKRLAYWQFDTSGVREFTLINNTHALYPELTSYPYPKVGQTNAAVRVGVVKASGGRTTWLRSNTDPRNTYLPEMEWSKDSRQVLFQQLNRLQNTDWVIGGDPRNGATQVLLTECDSAWVDVVETWPWVENGKRFLWLSERDGWRHLYAVDRTNQGSTLLTPGAFDVISIAGVDEERGSVYFIASPDNPTQRYLYRAPLDGQGAIVLVSPKDQPGTHSYEMSKDCGWAFHTYSRFGTPPVIELVSLPDHKVVRVLVDNATLRSKLAELKACPSEFFRVSITNGYNSTPGASNLPASTRPSGTLSSFTFMVSQPGARWWTTGGAKPTCGTACWRNRATS